MKSIFCIQEHKQIHKNNSDHWDLRIVQPNRKYAISFAIPKMKFPQNTSEKIGAYKAKNHDIDYMKFSGTLENGDQVKLYDYGRITYRLIKRDKVKIYNCYFDGNNIKGHYYIVNMKHGTDDWIIIKASEEEYTLDKKSLKENIEEMRTNKEMIYRNNNVTVPEFSYKIINRSSDSIDIYKAACLLRDSVRDDIEKARNSGVELPPRNRDWDEIILKQYFDCNGDYFIVQILGDGHLIGQGMVVKNVRKEFKICDVIIVPKFRGMGAGKNLVKQMIKLCKLKEPNKPVNLTVWKNNINAKKLYEELGFETVEYEMRFM